MNLIVALVIVVVPDSTLIALPIVPVALLPENVVPEIVRFCFVKIAPPFSVEVLPVNSQSVIVIVELELKIAPPKFAVFCLNTAPEIVVGFVLSL